MENRRKISANLVIYRSCLVLFFFFLRDKTYAMKSLFLYILIFMTLFSCFGKKEEEPPLPENHWGEASAQVNGAFWEAYPICRTDIFDKKSLSIKLDSFINGNYLVESLNLIYVPPVTGVYKAHKLVTATSAQQKPYSVLTMWDYDLPLGQYDLMAGDTTNWVSLDSYDTITKEISGRFELTFVVTKRPYANYPDTIRFRNGTYHGRLYR